MPLNTSSPCENVSAAATGLARNPAVVNGADTMCKLTAVSQKDASIPVPGVTLDSAAAAHRRLWTCVARLVSRHRSAAPVHNKPQHSTLHVRLQAKLKAWVSNSAPLQPYLSCVHPHYDPQSSSHATAHNQSRSCCSCDCSSASCAPCSAETCRCADTCCSCAASRCCCSAIVCCCTASC